MRWKEGNEKVEPFIFDYLKCRKKDSFRAYGSRTMTNISTIFTEEKALYGRAISLVKIYLFHNITIFNKLN